MTDTEVTTQVKTDLGLIHFQEYWVRAKGKIEIEQVVRSFSEPPVATEEVLAVIEASDAVVIGPSNPITSISPILACEGIKPALLDKLVIAISPFIGNAPVSGPAGALMQAAGFEPSSRGTLNCYDGITDIFVQDIRDPLELNNSVRFDTLMIDEEKSLALAQEILRLTREMLNFQEVFKSGHFLQTYIMPHSNGYRGRYEPKMDWKIVFSILLCFALISGCISSQEAAKGTLQLTSSPSGAEIYLDNQFREVHP